jgi:ribonuclease HI
MHTLCFDGCSKGNPGRGGSGAVLYDKDGKEIAHSIYDVGDSVTNNVAEYTGLIQGLELALDHHVTHLIVKGDSLLVIRQMKGEYKVNASHLIPLYHKAKLLLLNFNHVEFHHIHRKDNQRADELSNQALDKKI